jgi:hypothetical protein
LTFTSKHRPITATEAAEAVATSIAGKSSASSAIVKLTSERFQCCQ